MMLNDLCRKSLEDNPEKTAILCNERSLTYRELDESVRRNAAALKSLGIAYGDRVALFMRNTPEMVELYFACFTIGAVAVPLNSRLQTAEVVYACEKCTPRILIADGALFPRVKDLDQRLVFLDHLFVTGEAAAGDGRPWYGILGDAPTVDRFTLPDDPGHPAMILFTSGSTSKPKGVTHSHRSILSTVTGKAQCWKLDRDDIFLVGTHICHCAGSIGISFPILHVGGTVLLLEEFDPGVWLRLVKEYRPTRVGQLPAQLLDIVEHPEVKHVDYSSIKQAMTGGGLESGDLLNRFKELTGLDLVQSYGLTECEGCCIPYDGEPIRPGSVGRPRDNVQVRLADPTGTEVEAGRDGEMWIKGDSVMTGYWEDPENTEKTLVHGWLRTGDLMHRDGDGYFYFSGRIKEVIIKGGSNVAPGEVEEVLDACPGVADSGVVGAPDPHYGEVIHAFVELEPGSEKSVTVEQLKSYCSEKLAAYKVPDRWTVLDKLPRNAVDKIDKARLHSMAAETARLQKP